MARVRRMRVRRAARRERLLLDGLDGMDVEVATLRQAARDLWAELRAERDARRAAQDRIVELEVMLRAVDRVPAR